MDDKKTIEKLKKLSDSDLRNLLNMVQLELSERPEYLSNTENTPSEQCASLNSMFHRAWIHG